MNPIIVIPARYHSTRLPGKPLLDLCGISMIQRTYEQCAKGFPKERIFVATDDERVESHCLSFGINTMMTDRNCLTGTDRVAEVARMVEADFYINVQGDEPLFNPLDINIIQQAAAKSPNEVFNGVTEISNEADFRNPNVPKVVIRPDNRLLYMSRSAMPTNKSLGFVKAWRQVCIYGFPPAALKDYSCVNEKTTLEAIEDIEILRFLEMGFEIRMVPVSSDSISVDTVEDAAHVRALLNFRENSARSKAE